MLRTRVDGQPPITNVPACAGTLIHHYSPSLRLATLVAGILGAIAITSRIARVVLATLAAALLPAAALLGARLSFAVIMLRVLLATLLATLRVLTTLILADMVLAALVLVRHNTLAINNRRGTP
jgi:hypothetical protein